jgi:hypothetical protein
MAGVDPATQANARHGAGCLDARVKSAHECVREDASERVNDFDTAGMVI